MKTLDGVEIAFVAPCPRPDLPHEGWMSRIRAIDRQFVGRKRIYLNFSEQHAEVPSRIRWYSAERGEILLKPSAAQSEDLVGKIVQSVRGVYVHTLHLAEYMVSHLSSGKIIVDMHGVAPEEEELMGRLHLRDKYEEIERKVLKGAAYCVCVSNAMITHYRNKYPYLRPSWILIPIVEAYPEGFHFERPMRPDEESPKVIYSGGTQAWQNIDGMLKLMERCRQWARFRFLSHDFELIRRKAEAMGLGSFADFAYCSKLDLPAAYRAADFGLVLRDDTPINRVSCPTKLIEYLQFGLVPIVRTAMLGDFEELGFVYVKEEEFASGFFPDAASREWMIDRNREVLWDLSDRFRRGISILRDTI